VGVRSEDGEQFDENFSGGDPLTVQLGAGGVIEGWDAGLVGIRQGGRRQLDIPAEMAYGDAPRGEVIKAGDPLTFVIDAVAVVPTASAADQPDVAVEAAANQEELTFDDLVVGDGAEATEGASAAVQVTSYRADTGEELSSTYTGGAPLVFVVGDGTVIPGLDDAVTGMRAGGRRQAHVPFALAFGEEGRPGASVPGSLDIVLVVDLVTVF
jgi:FKBP-type peptidyl-prolyl cis-trans isomerase